MSDSSYQFFRKLIERGPENKRGMFLFPILIAASKLYTFAVKLRLAAFKIGFFKSYRSSIPVISIGNLTVGGTGKTPVVDELVRRAVAAGKRVAIVSRGYGGKRKVATALVADGRAIFRDQPDLYGDEPVLLARRNPEAVVIVARRRSEGVVLAENLGAEIAILDDGYQHLALDRDLDIVLLDAKNPFGNRRLLPAGILREPVSSLNRADLVIMTRCNAKEAPDLGLQIPVLTSTQVLSDELSSLHGEDLLWDGLANLRCVAFAGIARPEVFFDALRQKGIMPIAEIALVDHQSYNQEVLQSIRAACEHADLCLTTEKDAVKLSPDDLPIPCYAVALELKIHPEPLLDDLVAEYF